MFVYKLGGGRFETSCSQRAINSYTFVQEAKTWKIYQDKEHFSNDVEYPLVSTAISINDLIDTLNSNNQQLRERTKLTLRDMHKLTELSLKEIIFACFRTVNLLDFLSC